jgi:hypothetical protein
VAWEVLLTEQVERWLVDELDDAGRVQIIPAIDKLEEVGPPVVDRVKGSRHHNMKELRSTGGNIRVLFAFDPKRQAILLLGGDKTGQWKRWYAENIPIADDLYDAHLENL